MGKSVWLGIAICTVVMLLPFSAFAADATALVYINGKATINGLGMGRATWLFSGDRLETTAGAVTIRANGTTVLVPENTRLIFNGNSIRLDKGTAEITTTRRMTARAGNLRIKPMGDSARYQIAQLGETIEVIARSGALSIHDGKSSILLPEGSSISSVYSSKEALSSFVGRTLLPR
jgi:hypothetical protein